MDDTNATQPNAYRIEAEEKRQQIISLAAEANALDAKAQELEDAANDVTAESPAESATESKPVAEPKEEKKGFLRK